MEEIRIRHGNVDDLADFQQLFADTISTVCRADYNDDQITAWVLSSRDRRHWTDILINQYVLLSQDREGVTGFCTLDKGNYK